MDLVTELVATAEVCGTNLSEVAAELILQDLEKFPEPQVRGALTRCRRELKGRLTLAEIITRLDDGRPGPEEAWGMIPKSEDDTAVWTNEMAIASAASQPLLDAGDKVAARMAFKERYTQLVAEARAAGTPVEWQVSLGYDKTAREGPIREAVMKGRLTAAQAERYVPIEATRDTPLLAGGSGMTSIGDVIARKLIGQ